MDPKQKNEEKVPKSPKRKKGETLDEKVQRHLKDKNDIITEEDLRDVVMGGNTAQEKEEGEEMADDLTKKKPTTTPWDILDEES